MARAFVCDRCGAVFSDNTSKCRFTLFDVEKEEDIAWTGRYRDKVVGDMMDLCPKCNMDLIEFVHKKKPL